MARITIEDALKKIPNRFQLTVVAAARAREIANGDQPKVSGFDNKPVVLALREIEAGKTGIEILDKED
jgi:DNA-directed RNA polymerase subunit omega